MFSKKKKLIVALNLHHSIVATESKARIFFIFWPSKIHVSLTSIVSPLPDATSPLVDIATPSRRVMFPCHAVKMSSLSLLHLPAMLHPIISPLELKLKH
jgi:hypothetical protein